MKREFLMLAQTYKPSRHYVGGWCVSEKLDGMRCFWDGGVSTGIPKAEVPWANHKKDDRYLEPPIATGLWSRLGNVIHAPESFIKSLPAVPLDGELYKKGHRQDLMSTVKRLIPDDWDGVEYHVFDIPSLSVVFETGYLNSTNFRDKTLNWDECNRLIMSRGIRWLYDPYKIRTFHTTIALLNRMIGSVVHPLHQSFLPNMQSQASLRLITTLNNITDNGGEGLMLRNPDSVWAPERSHNLLKMKAMEDDEATVVGYVTGRETDKGSKLLGMMGALVLDYNGQRLELSGFTEAERTLVLTAAHSDDHHYTEAQQWATENPETECPDWISAKHFHKGMQVTFKFRGKSRDGIPQEARFWRKHV